MIPEKKQSVKFYRKKDTTHKYQISFLTDNEVLLPSYIAHELAAVTTQQSGGKGWIEYRNHNLYGTR